MADDPNDEATKAAIAAAKPALRGLVDEAIKYATEKIPALAKSLGSSASQSASDTANDFKQKMDDVAKGTNEDFFKEWGKSFKDVSGKIADEFNTSMSGAVAIGDLFHDKGFQDKMGQITGAATTFFSNHKIDVAEFVLFDRMPTLVLRAMNAVSGGVVSQLIDMDGKVAEFTKAFSSQVAGMRGDLTDASKNSLGETTALAIGQVGDAMKGLGVAKQDAMTAMSDFMKKNVNAGDIANIKLSVDTKDGNEKLQGLTAALAIAKGTGQTTGETFGALSTMMRTLGYNADTVGQAFGTMKAAQEGTKLSFGEVQTAVMGGAEQLKYYGTNIESLSGVFKSLVSSVGEGREELAKPMFDSIISGIGNMDFAKKAFLASQSGIGQGRDAVSGGLEFEEAVKNGDFDKIIDTIQQTIEKQTNSKVLSRKEALETGQGEKYLMQRKIYQQFVGGNDGQADEGLNLLGSDRTRAAQLIGKSKQGENVIADSGQKTIIAETGAIANVMNRAQSEYVQSVKNFTQSYLTNAEQIAKGTSDIMTMVSQSWRKGTAAATDRANKVSGDNQQTISNSKPPSLEYNNFRVSHEKKLEWQDSAMGYGSRREAPAEGESSQRNYIHRGQGPLMNKNSSSARASIGENPLLSYEPLSFDMNKVEAQPNDMPINDAAKAMKGNTASKNGPQASAENSKVNVAADVSLNITVDQAGAMAISAIATKAAKAEIHKSDLRKTH